jgi:NAD binding domain of 6-phosphogluconate dehydrogenase
MNVGWIGTGKLGLPMAARIAASGAGVRAYVRSPNRIEAIGARNVVCVTFQEMAAQNIVFISLPDDAALRQVADELIPVLRRGAVLVETSTVSPTVSDEIGKELAAHGIAYLRGPVSGNPMAAEAGKLTAMVSGPKEVFEVIRPLMASYSQAVLARRRRAGALREAGGKPDACGICRDAWRGAGAGASRQCRYGGCIGLDRSVGHRLADGRQQSRFSESGGLYPHIQWTPSGKRPGPDPRCGERHGRRRAANRFYANAVCSAWRPWRD